MKHFNYPQDIVRAWDTGEPLAAVCGYERVLVEGQVPEGETCQACIETTIALQKVRQTRIVMPKVIQTPTEIRAMAAQAATTWRFYRDGTVEKWQEAGRQEREGRRHDPA